VLSFMGQNSWMLKSAKKALGFTCRPATSILQPHPINDKVDLQPAINNDSEIDSISFTHEACCITVACKADFPCLEFF
jgi:hypothetical protein